MSAITSGPAPARKPKPSAAPYPSPPTSPRPIKSAPPNTPSGVSTASPAIPSPSPSPERRPTLSKAAVAPAAKPASDAEKAEAVEDLKRRLGLDGDTCGATKANGDPCRYYSSQSAKIPHLAPRLASMVQLTQASTDLEEKLDKLASFWHCQYHGGARFKNPRIESWTKQFPAAKATKAIPPPSIEKQIRKLLDLESDEFWGSWQERVTCTAIASSTMVRCKQNIGGQKVQNCRATVETIVKPETYQNDSQLEWWLKVLETNMHCRYHVKKPLDRTEGWKSAITAMRGKSTVESRTVGSPPTPPGTPGSSKGSGNNTTGSSASPRGNSSSPDLRCHPSQVWEDKYDESPFHIISKSEGLADSRHQRIGKRIKEEFMMDPEAVGEGYVYAFEVPGNPGLVKIGYTSRSVEIRHEEWKFACNREPRLLYPTAHGGLVAKVRHAHRVEALCHEDLEHRRIRIYCSACMKQHLEWFEVSSAEAVIVIRKWSEWMLTDPYQSTTLRSGTKWAVREKERKRTAIMGKFMTQILEAAYPEVDARRRSGGVTDEGKKVVRKSGRNAFLESMG